jgi:hypothetical protein
VHRFSLSERKKEKKRIEESVIAGVGRRRSPVVGPNSQGFAKRLDPALAPLNFDGPGSCGPLSGQAFFELVL